jgi:DNA-binding IscR family transcriptional regulator
MSWNFLTNHGRALVCIARDPEVRLRDIAVSLNITERRAQGIVTSLTDAGYVVKTKEGRRNHYRIVADLPLIEHTGRLQAIGDVLHLLSESESAPRTLRTRVDDGEFPPHMNGQPPACREVPRDLLEGRR